MLRGALRQYFTPAELAALQNTRIGIAGAGGLGSNAAMMLARSGIENLVIIDRDIIESSNLNRQHYWPDDVGMPKVEALALHLKALNPHLKLTICHLELQPGNLSGILRQAQIWMEALDDAFLKKRFVDACLESKLPVVAVSGIGGYAGPPMQKKRLGDLTIVGDLATDVAKAPPLAPRVIQASAMAADAILEMILHKIPLASGAGFTP